MELQGPSPVTPDFTPHRLLPAYAAIQLGIGIRAGACQQNRLDHSLTPGLPARVYSSLLDQPRSLLFYSIINTIQSILLIISILSILSILLILSIILILLILLLLILSILYY